MGLAVPAVEGSRMGDGFDIAEEEDRASNSSEDSAIAELNARLVPSPKDYGAVAKVHRLPEPETVMQDPHPVSPSDPLVRIHEESGPAQCSPDHQSPETAGYCNTEGESSVGSLVHITGMEPGSAPAFHYSGQEDDTLSELKKIRANSRTDTSSPNADEREHGSPLDLVAAAAHAKPPRPPSRKNSPKPPLASRPSSPMLPVSRPMSPLGTPNDSDVSGLLGLGGQSPRMMRASDSIVHQPSSPLSGNSALPSGNGLSSVPRPPAAFSANGSPQRTSNARKMRASDGSVMPAMGELDLNNMRRQSNYNMIFSFEPRETVTDIIQKALASKYEVAFKLTGGDRWFRISSDIDCVEHCVFLDCLM